jgi:hypothetical protein
MGQKWATARHCQDVLNILVADLRVQHGEDTSSTKWLDSNGRPKSSYSRRKTQRVPIDVTPSKRQKLGSKGFTSEEPAETIDQVPQNQQHGINAYNLASSQSFSLAAEQDNEFQWLEDPALQGVVPDMQDIFGHLSWESLFQGDGTDTYLWPNYTSDRQDVSGSVIGGGSE